MPHVIANLRADGVAELTLARPERHNAFDEGLVAALLDALGGWAADPRVRALVLRAHGRSFSAGADLEAMQRAARAPVADNERDAQQIAALMESVDKFPLPTLALVQGPAYGGGVGLVAACDLVLATPEAKFALTEVRLGLAPAVISPYVIAAIGVRACRRYMLTAESFDAVQAQQLGLVHEVVEATSMEERASEILGRWLDAGPQALRATKALIADVAAHPGRAHASETAPLIARLRASEEGREGLAAFLERRRARWAAPR
jgi:methylglutaconyl-CoA hydratase